MYNRLHLKWPNSLHFLERKTKHGFKYGGGEKPRRRNLKQNTFGDVGLSLLTAIRRATSFDSLHFTLLVCGGTSVVVHTLALSEDTTLGMSYIVF